MHYDFSRLYRTSVRKSIDEDRFDIIETFQEIIKQRSRVRLSLVNYYRGLPICYHATAVEMDRGTLELDVHRHQAMALQDNGQTFIKCDDFPSPMLALVQNVNLRRMAASLRNFVFVDIMAERRSALRLELDPPLEVEVRIGATTMTARVLDLSLGGGCLHLPEPWYAEGAEVSLRLAVPDPLQKGSTLVEAEALHIGTFDRDGRGGDLCRFSWKMDHQSERVISRFMFQRQVDIIREIKETCAL
jgi:hypothetical protein